MQIEWAFKGEQLAGHATVLDRYSKKEFDSPTRSTIPLLEFWRSPGSRVKDLSAALRLPVPHRVQLDFEHLVRPPRGSGKESQTDLMVLSPQHAIAMEAKWTEPRYDDVDKWLRNGSANRKAVLQGWCELLQQHGAGPIAEGSLLKLPYQMVHRAASACHAIKAGYPLLVYLVFEPTAHKRREYLSDLSRLRDALGPRSSLVMALAECRIEQLPLLAKIRRRWDAGKRDLHEPVLRGLRSGELLRAVLEHVHRLSP